MRVVAKVQQSAKSAREVLKVQRKYEMGARGYTPLFYNSTMTIGSRYGCILLCLPFGFVFRQIHRLYLLWVSRRVMHNSVWLTLYRYNYSKTAGVFILGRNRL